MRGSASLLATLPAAQIRSAFGPIVPKRAVTSKGTATENSAHSPRVISKPVSEQQIAWRLAGAIQSGGLPQLDRLPSGSVTQPNQPTPSNVLHLFGHVRQRQLPRPHGKAGHQAAMIMAECPTGMARQIQNATFTLVDRGSSP